MSLVESTTRARPAFRSPLSRGEPHAEGLVDTVIAAGALAAWADGSVHPVERLEILVYLRRSGLSLLHRRDVLEIFDRRVRALKHDPACAVQETRGVLEGFVGSSLAWTVLRAAEHVAAADSQIRDAEVTMIESIRVALGLPGENRRQPSSA